MTSPPPQQQPSQGAAAQSMSSYRPLNVRDALSYLDQVKVQFESQPDVYNRFLDIMKEFKSQNIDTPGVISRVSTLFRGHNNLIQGFNTFLPPGYRIECSLDPSDPNPIRVTTPRGSTSRPNDEPGYEQWNAPPPQHQQSPPQQPQQLPPEQFQQQQQALQQPYGASSNGAGGLPGARPAGVNGSGPSPGAPPPLNPQIDGVGDNGQQGPSSVAPGGPATPAGAAANPGDSPAPGSDYRRPGDPVEFNYAISYVNKIKTRFANQPEIYNTFLEILQTYHREQLQINEVYVQVTQLFQDAPDLLDNFKQFLPDMSQPQGPLQQAPPPQQQPQHVLPPPQQQQSLLPPPPQQQPQQQQPQHIMGPGADNLRLPPVGNFSPPNIAGSGLPSAGAPLSGPHPHGMPVGMVVPPLPVQSTPAARGDRKKRSSAGGANVGANAGQYNEVTLYQQQQQQAQAQQHLHHPHNGYEMPLPVSNARGQTVKKSRNRGDAPPSPSLVPALPEPISAGNQLTGEGANSVLMEEITFFDKAKRFIANKYAYNEFLKVLNLFSQRIIDKNLLVERVEGFLGANRELMGWFKDFVKYDGKPLHIENIPYKKHLLELSLCRSYGRSYRLLPKSEPYMPCSGRDEMCWEVLNDEWVGHPVWASEEAGFVAHRKNQYEEIMHRVEEERHEYDYYIEANLRSIQTLETLASRIANMADDEKEAFKLPPNLGHTSTIYEKVLKKIYGEARYKEVVEALRDTPAVAVPIVLRRMKQKDEEWKRAHREWNKVWRDTEQKVFFKSLDHRGLTFKQTDKKYLTTRQLVSEITTVKTEQSNKRISPHQPVPKEQLVYSISDYSVLMDLVRVVMCFLSHSGSYSSNDRERMEVFFKSFLRLFFSLPDGLLPLSTDSDSASVDGEGTSPVVNGTANGTNGSVNGSSGSSSTSAATNSSGSTNGSKKRARDTSGEMLRDILKKSKQAKRFRDDSANVDEDEEPEEEEEDAIERAGELWLRHVNSTTDLFESRPRDTFNLFANNTVYVFLRLIVILYERLAEVKSYEFVVSDEIADSRNVPFAIDLDLYDNRMANMGLAFDSKDCYGQLLNLIERLIEGDLEHQWYEEAIRQAYRNRAYKLYTVDKVAQAIVKHLHNIVSDAKSSDVLVLWEHDRTNPVTSTKEQILYRMRVKSVLGPEENMFRVEWNNKTRDMLVQFLGTDDLSLKHKRSTEQEWNYYLTSYLMAGPTEGVPTDKVRVPFLQRNLTDESVPENDDEEKKEGEEKEDETDFIDTVDQSLAIRLSVPTYQLFFEPNTSDYFSRKAGVSTNSSTEAAEQKRTNKWLEFFEGPKGWKRDIPAEDAQDATARYNAWKFDNPSLLTTTAAAPAATAPALTAPAVAGGDTLVPPTASTLGDTTETNIAVSGAKDNDVTMSDVSASNTSANVSADMTRSAIEQPEAGAALATSTYEQNVLPAISKETEPAEKKDGEEEKSSEGAVTAAPEETAAAESKPIVEEKTEPGAVAEAAEPKEASPAKELAVEPAAAPAVESDVAPVAESAEEPIAPPATEPAASVTEPATDPIDVSVGTSVDAPATAPTEAPADAPAAAESVSVPEPVTDVTAAAPTESAEDKKTEFVEPEVAPEATTIVAASAAESKEESSLPAQAAFEVAPAADKPAALSPSASASGTAAATPVAATEEETKKDDSGDDKKLLESATAPTSSGSTLTVAEGDAKDADGDVKMD